VGYQGKLLKFFILIAPQFSHLSNRVSSIRENRKEGEKTTRFPVKFEFQISISNELIS
jgi:hypothetical protein